MLRDRERHEEEPFIYIGVDPGASGGLAAVWADDSDATRMPDTERDVWEWFNTLSEYRCFAVIEKVHAMPGNGVSGMFKFGMSYGGLRMALAASKATWEEIPPQQWQKALGIIKRDKTESGPDWKGRLKAKAQQLFPKVQVTLATADALLIAEYCRRKRTGTLGTEMRYASH